MKTTLAVIASAVFAVSAGSSAADSNGPPAPAEFAELDTNADMYIDKQEFEQFSEQMREKMRERMRERFQGGARPGGKAGGDRAAQLYAEADADRDGLLNESEFEALKASVQAMREKMRQRWGGAEKGE